MGLAWAEISVGGFQEEVRGGLTEAVDVSPVASYTDSP